MRTSCILLIVVALVAQYPDTAMAKKAVACGHGGSFAPQDCRTLPPRPGPCAPASCSQSCRNDIGFGAAGYCAAGGCQCTYCAPPKSE
ncbi:hypothetical protein PAHAL_2G105200 [Panicum hallii]|uniref:Knottin scorpion toxin-like domain-containing protein n=1 Tax=Panicum hallii TaxID=206008 RepID=A0A2S3GXI7_9POAL|nr:hypothetical protein PAHAL_2G105200 [Panicum hallii]